MSSGRIIKTLIVLFVFAAAIAAYADGPVFRADYIFQGSSLNEWKPVGNATWKAENGIITGTAKSPDGGWLFLDGKMLADVGLFSEVNCPAKCEAGFLFRAEKTDSGMKGLFVSLSSDDRNSYAVTLDADGKILTKEKLAANLGMGAQGGLANEAGNIDPEKLKMIMKTGIKILPLPDQYDLPNLRAKDSSYKLDGWNEINITVYGDMLNPVFNAAGFSSKDKMDKSLAPASAGAYGKVALYIGGSGEAKFRNVQLKNYNTLKVPKETASPEFTAQHINGFYFSWGATVADVNKDGKPDVIAGPYYFLGPDFTEAHEIYTPTVYNAGSDYPQVSMVMLAADFTGDGWPDVLAIGGSAGLSTGTLYVNPKGEARHWDKYIVLPTVGNETSILADVDGDGKLAVIHAKDNQIVYSRPDPKNPTAPWISTPMTEPGPWGTSIGHGLGMGDINGDGLPDLVTAYGWWEHPAKGTTAATWKYHPVELGRWGNTAGGAGGAELGVYDVNGDGLNDVVTALEGHGFGLAWYEQKRDSSGNITFVRHIIMDNFLTKNAGDVTFTEPHASTFADMDGDGIPDLIVGKRMMSHLFAIADPDPFGPAVLYVYRTVRDKSAPGGAKFVPTLVHNMSGVGSGFAVVDVNGDGKPDIVTTGVYGTFVFYNHMQKTADSTPAASGQNAGMPK